MRALVSQDIALDDVLQKFRWCNGRFDGAPDLWNLRTALPVFISRVPRGGLDGRHEFERRATGFINKVTPRNARQAAEELASSGMWSGAEERNWRLHAFAALLLRSFARVARYRPARGDLFRDLSILSSQVSAASELVSFTPGLREAIDLWVFKLLGCQKLWEPQRLAVCSVHARLSKEGMGIGVLSATVVRNVLTYIYPESSPVQRELCHSHPPHAVPTEIAIVFGHIIWSCTESLWHVWGFVALTVVETLLATVDSCRTHQAAIVLSATCGRLSREPLKDASRRAVVLGRALAKASWVLGSQEGFVRHRIACAVEAAELLEVRGATRLQAAWRGRRARRLYR